MKLTPRTSALLLFAALASCSPKQSRTNETTTAEAAVTAKSAIEGSKVMARFFYLGEYLYAPMTLPTNSEADDRTTVPLAGRRMTWLLPRRPARGMVVQVTPGSPSALRVFGANQ